MRSVIGWDRYFMNIAQAVSLRSKDPNTQVGAVIIDSNKHIIACGFNGFSPGVEENKVRWSKKLKEEYVCHAEINALLRTNSSVIGATLYTTLYPCPACTKYIITAGIKKIIYEEYRYGNDMSKKLFLESGVKCEKIVFLS